jgi:hypothetical protein
MIHRSFLMPLLCGSSVTIGVTLSHQVRDPIHELNRLPPDLELVGILALSLGAKDQSNLKPSQPMQGNRKVRIGLKKGLN